MKLLDINGLRAFLAQCRELFVTKEAGKGLSTNDFTDEYKAKLDSGEFLTEEKMMEILEPIGSYFDDRIKKIEKTSVDEEKTYTMCHKIFADIYEKNFGMHSPFARHYTSDKLRDDLPDNMVVSMLKDPEHPEQRYDFYIKIKGKWERIGA